MTAARVSDLDHSGGLLFGLGPDGKVVGVDDVERGLSCGVTCPACGMRLVAKQGDVYAHHFAHEASGACATAYETILHQLAKQIVAEAGGVTLPSVEASYAGLRKRLAEKSWIDLEDVSLEVWMDGFRPDIIGRKGDREIAIEVLVTHPCGPEKIALIRERRTACIEIDLSALSRESNRQMITNAVLHSAPRRWIFNRRIEALVQDLRAERDRINEAVFTARQETERMLALERRREAEAAAALKLANAEAAANHRMRELIDLAMPVCAVAQVPVDTFLNTALPGWLVPVDVARRGGNDWYDLRNTLNGWRCVIEGREGEPRTDWLNLGQARLQELARIRAEIRAQQARSEAEARKREADREAAAELADFKERIWATAVVLLGEHDAIQWIEQGRPGLPAVNSLAFPPARERPYFSSLDEECARKARAADSRADLIRKARSKFRSEEELHLWARSINPALGRRRPLDVCLDGASLETCLRLLDR